MAAGTVKRPVHHRREPDALRPRSDARRASRCSGLDFLVVQDIFLSETAAAGRRRAAGGELRREGRHLHQHRAQGAARARGRAEPGRGARRLGDHRRARAPPRRRRRLGLRAPRATSWTRSTRSRPPTPASRYERLDAEGGLCWPCPDTTHPGTPILHIGQFTRGRGKFFPIAYQPPAEVAGDEYPLTLTTGRMLEHYHTGTMTRRSDGLNELVPTGFAEIHPDDAARLGVSDGVAVSVETRRGVDQRARPTSPRACARAPCSCRSTSGSRRPTGSPTPPATRWPRSPSSRCAPAGSPPDGRRCGGGRALIPLHDDVPTRRFAVVTLVVIVLNVGVFAFELALPRYGMTLGGLLRQGRGHALRARARPRRAARRPRAVVGDALHAACSCTAAGCT